jgi:hypothetical protein
VPRCWPRDEHQDLANEAPVPTLRGAAATDGRTLGDNGSGEW